MSRPVSKISIVITSRDRGRFLRRNFDALRALELPEGVAVELVHIDNGSTDDTQEILAEERAKGFPFETVFDVEPIPGRAQALNTALERVSGDLFFMVDDDAFVRPDWLVETYRAFVEEDADLVGGRLVAPPDIEFPDWFRLPEMRGIVAVLDWGDEPRLIVDDMPYGANMAFRTQLARELGGFDLRLGRTPTSLLAGEEYDLCKRILAVGGKGIYWPTSVSEHQVRTERLNKNYCRRWKWGASRSGFYNQHPLSVARFLGIPRFILGDIVRRSVEWVRTLVLGPRRDLFLAELAWIGSIAALYEAIWGHRKVGLLPRRPAPPASTVSVVIPAHNAADTIEETLRSILAGRRTPDEIIVVDDRSDDDTAARARAVDARVRVIDSPAPGPSAARNAGIVAASSDWIAFCDADDLWTEGRLADQFEALRTYPEAMLVTSRIDFFDESGRSWEWNPKTPPPGIAGQHLEFVLRHLFLNTQTALARRRGLLAVGGFDEQLDRSEDFDLFSRLAARYPTMFVDALGAHKRVRSDSLSSDREGMFDTLEEIVERRLAESGWDERRCASVRRGFRRTMLPLRAAGRLAAGDRRGARRDALGWVGLDLLNPRAWVQWFKTLLPMAARGETA